MTPHKVLQVTIEQPINITAAVFDIFLRSQSKTYLIAWTCIVGLKRISMNPAIIYGVNI